MSKPMLGISKSRYFVDPLQLQQVELIKSNKTRRKYIVTA